MPDPSLFGDGCSELLCSNIGVGVRIVLVASLASHAGDIDKTVGGCRDSWAKASGKGNVVSRLTSVASDDVDGNEVTSGKSDDANVDKIVCVTSRFNAGRFESG